MRAGSADTRELARLANEYPPVLRTHDSRGHRIDEVEFHPAWHELMATAVSHGLHAAPWLDDTPGAHVARAARFYVWTQAEAGHGCPISMTYAAVPALRHEPALASRFASLLASRAYDPGLRVPDGKAGLLAGMAMTEKQGGSDVRANTTRAVPAGGDGYLLTGHKWFCSAPMCDLFLVLAQAPEGLGCFLLPRVLPDGTRNAMRIQRLKDKLGNRSNASSEVEYDAAFAWRVGEPGRGVATIIEMVSATRLDCVLGSAAAIRQAVVAALYYASAPALVRGHAGLPPPDGVRPGRPGPRVRGGHGAGDAPGGRRRPGGARRRGRGGAAAAGPARGQVLGVQAGADGHRGGAGVPGRQRLRRGLGPAAAVPGCAAQLRLGRLGQRDRPRRAPRAGARSRLGRRAARRDRPGRGR